MRFISILLLCPLLAFGQIQDSCYSINQIFVEMEEDNLTVTKNFLAGWNMFGFPCSNSIDLVEAFSSIKEMIVMVKDNNGKVYMPEFGFNGIGFLEGGEGYQIKMQNTVYGFSFCESINWPNLEGCSDCQASNFSQWANVDDGSCNYDSDGDGVLDSEEIVGCQDESACNFNELATDEGLCNYAEQGYDCEGNINVQVGDEAFGGIVFYVDESGYSGLVAAIDDLDGNYSWGCEGEIIDGADGTAIGHGYQNTIDIIAGCSETIIAASQASKFELAGYSDWYLPSKDELLEMYSTIGNAGPEGNVGGFTNYPYWSSSKVSNFNAWYVNFSNGSLTSWYRSWYYKVRLIRTF